MFLSNSSTTSTTSTTAAPLPDNTTSTTTSSLPPEEWHQLLTMSEYVSLCLVVALCYYGAMCVSSLAVGESYSSLVSPFSLLKTALIEIYETLWHRRGRVGVVYDEENE